MLVFCPTIAMSLLTRSSSVRERIKSSYWPYGRFTAHGVVLHRLAVVIIPNVPT